MEEMENMLDDQGLTDSVKEMVISYLTNYYENKINKQINIPKIIHLIYLNDRPLNSYNYSCFDSIIRYMNDYDIWVHNDVEPNDEHWNKFKSNNNVYIKKIKRIKIFDSFSIKYVQYESDIIRMNILYEYGGIYLDNDIYLVNNIDSLLESTYSVYISKETEENIINCVLISEPNNEFIKIWLDNFSMGFRMNNWGWHIRNLPKILLEKYPYYINKYNIKLLDNIVFCPIHWTQGYLLNDKEFKLKKETYGIHLFETILGNVIDIDNLSKF
jgi:mannosyltransferase OCH1-like enzyme